MQEPHTSADTQYWEVTMGWLYKWSIQTSMLSVKSQSFMQPYSSTALLVQVEPVAP